MISTRRCYGLHCDRKARAGLEGATAFVRCRLTATRPADRWPACCGPANAGATTAADQIAVAETALEQIPREHNKPIEILLPSKRGCQHDAAELGAPQAEYRILPSLATGKLTVVATTPTRRELGSARARAVPIAGMRRARTTVRFAPEVAELLLRNVPGQEHTH
jgi:hypothetical protein